MGSALYPNLYLIANSLLRLIATLGSQLYCFHIVTGCSLVPGGGIEPPWNCFRRILSPLRLPVPPSRLLHSIFVRGYTLGRIDCILNVTQRQSGTDPLELLQCRTAAVRLPIPAPAPPKQWIDNRRWG